MVQPLLKTNRSRCGTQPASNSSVNSRWEAHHGTIRSVDPTFRTVHSRITSRDVSCSSTDYPVESMNTRVSDTLQLSLSSSEESETSCEPSQERFLECMDLLNALNDRVNTIEYRILDLEQSQKTTTEDNRAVTLAKIIYGLLKYIKSTAAC